MKDKRLVWSPPPTSRRSPSSVYTKLHGGEVASPVLLLPHPHPYSLSSLCPLGVPPVLSFVLQVVALRLATLRPVKAG